MIDESTENFISQEMVDMLGLKVEELDKPYKVTFFKEASKVLIIHYCLVKFSIGKVYQDAVICDVMPLKIYHI